MIEYSPGSPPTSYAAHTLVGARSIFVAWQIQGSAKPHRLLADWHLHRFARSIFK